MNVFHNDILAAMIVCSELGTVMARPFVGHVVEKDGVPVGAFILNGWDRVNCDLTVVGKGCWTPSTVRYMARYIFGQLGCKRVSARTRQSNATAIKALERIGFQFEGTQRQGFGNEDAARYGLLASEQRIIKL